MGSDKHSKRKRSDAPIIRIPISFSSIVGENKKGIPEIVSETCPTSFQEPVENSPFLRDGIKVFLEKRNERYAIMIQATQIGLLSKRNSLKISKCLELGVRYSGKIVIQKEQYYARFFRESN